jgi:hypothetical protein
MIHDDGYLQALYMETILNGVTLCVRTIRRCKPYVGNGFFQLQAPPGIRHHTGG